MNGFSDEEFSLDRLKSAPPQEELEPGYLAGLDYALRVRAWRNEVRRFLERSSPWPSESVAGRTKSRTDPLEENQGGL
jgi:hypothetical protein